MIGFRVPINVNEEFQRMLRTRERHVKDHGAEPTDEELIEELGMTKRRYLAVKNAFRVSVRLDAPFSYTRDNSADSRGDSMEVNSLQFLFESGSSVLGSFGFDG